MNKDNNVQPAANALAKIWPGYATLVNKNKNGVMLCQYMTSGIFDIDASPGTVGNTLNKNKVAFFIITYRHKTGQQFKQPNTQTSSICCRLKDRTHSS